jgi:pimeloyl-ACP methyl ester carboxylesterase
MSDIVLVLGTTIIAGVVLLAALKAFRTYSRELRKTFTPPRGRLTLPSSLAYDGARHVSFTTSGGTTLRGWYVSSANGAAVVLVHGSPGTRLDMVDDAASLQRAGFGVLLFDLPGHGESDGQVTWGTPDQEAVRAAIRFVAARREVDPSRVGVVGFSLGASLVARVVARTEGVRAVVLAGAYGSVEAQVRAEFASWGPVTQVPAIAAMRAGGLAVDELRASDVIAELAVPLLFVAGDCDRTVPIAMTRALFDAARGDKELLVVRGAAHGGYAAAGGPAYVSRIQEFFLRTLTPLPGWVADGALIARAEHPWSFLLAPPITSPRVNASPIPAARDSASALS